MSTLIQGITLLERRYSMVAPVCVKHTLRCADVVTCVYGYNLIGVICTRCHEP